MRRKLSSFAWLALAVLLALCPAGAAAQSVRGDIDWDGDFDVADLSYLIDYLLQGEWNDVPVDLERRTFTVNGVSFEMVHVEAGTLTRDDGGVYYVPDFWIATTEVTRELWAAVNGGTPDGPRKPLTMHSWTECQAFNDSLSALTGIPFRFPTSIEWEFAARGGIHSRGFTYSGCNNPKLVASYSGNNLGILPVASLRCNELGIYDMSGNVSEWCKDGPWDGVRYYCGGNCESDMWNIRPNSRNYIGPSSTGRAHGFRLAFSQ